MDLGAYYVNYSLFWSFKINEFIGTVKKNIESERYSNMKEIADDIRLVFFNCMLYNKDGSEV